MTNLERRRNGIWAFAALLFVPTLALAQDKPVTFNVGVGVILPQGDVGDRFDAGVNVPIGVTFNISETVGIQGEYSYSWMGGPDGTVTPIGGSPTLLESNHSIHMGSANVKFSPQTSGAVGGYLLGGLGIYHRSVELTTPAVGLVTVCDPWWYVCYPVAVEVDQVVGSRSTNDFGVNFGGAVTFARRFYVEARFHYVWGPEFERPEIFGGGRVKANGYYFPINFGVLF
jgi:hypothetical protein